MAVYETWSMRQKRLSGEVQDVFVYDHIPDKLRIQVAHIFDDTIGPRDELYIDSVSWAYNFIADIFRRKNGVFTLIPGRDRRNINPYDEIIVFIQTCSTEDFLDLVEASFRIVDRVTRKKDYRGDPNANARASEAITELNIRFKEAGVGYQFVDGHIIRVDSELIHQEAVKPALRLLNTKEYAGAHEEFINAYDHYKAGKNKEALNDCLKAFESTMKAICDKQGWTYQPGDTAKKLIDICFEKGLIPSFWQQQFNSLRSLLESSIPTGRNKLSGHGQGATPQAVPDYLTAYMLHMTASTLVFLTTAEKELP